MLYWILRQQQRLWPLCLSQIVGFITTKWMGWDRTTAGSIWCQGDGEVKATKKNPKTDKHSQTGGAFAVDLSCPIGLIVVVFIPVFRWQENTIFKKKHISQTNSCYSDTHTQIHRTPRVHWWIPLVELLHLPIKFSVIVVIRRFLSQEDL